MLWDEESAVFVAREDKVHSVLTPWCEELNVHRTSFVRKIHSVPLMYNFLKLNEQAAECFLPPPRVFHKFTCFTYITISFV